MIQKDDSSSNPSIGGVSSASPGVPSGSGSNAPSWNERYSSENYFYGTEPNDFLKDQALAERGVFRPGARVLCLAEGEGRNAVFLASLGCDVTGVDGSSVGLEKMQRLAADRGVLVHSVVSDLANYEFGFEQWDAVVSVWCHLPPGLRAQVHSKAVAALKAGGLLVLEAYRPQQLQYKTGGPPDVALLMTPASLQAELKGLEVRLLREVDREIHEGRGHSGMSAVVQLVATKKSSLEESGNGSQGND